MPHYVYEICPLGRLSLTCLDGGQECLSIHGPGPRAELHASYSGNNIGIRDL